MKGEEEQESAGRGTRHGDEEEEGTTDQERESREGGWEGGGI